MSLNARLEIRQGQGLVVTPQLQQAIKLLQLSNLELESFVEAELERNPLLQRAEPERRPAEAAPQPMVWRGSGSGAAPFDGDEAPLRREKTLHEHLHDQLAMTRLEATERAIANVLIEAVDEGGYLRTPLAEIAMAAHSDLELPDGPRIT